MVAICLLRIKDDNKERCMKSFSKALARTLSFVFVASCATAIRRFLTDDNRIIATLRPAQLAKKDS